MIGNWAVCWKCACLSFALAAGVAVLVYYTVEQKKLMWAALLGLLTLIFLVPMKDMRNAENFYG